jgi:hypothetical protein
LKATEAAATRLFEIATKSPDYCENKSGLCCSRERTRSVEGGKRWQIVGSVSSLYKVDLDLSNKFHAIVAPRDLTSSSSFAGFGSILIEVEAGDGIALCIPLSQLVAGTRLLYRPLTGTTETLSVGIARATKGDVTPAGDKFCEILRTTLHRATTTKAKRSSETGHTGNGQAMRVPKPHDAR